ncbi:MAG: transglutaminase family protein, partial [Cytophagales bacterium]|nr:transglutaminase family protein [Cytophagales bacterium]
MNYQITHTTKYIYKESVALCHNEAKLFPKSIASQVCLDTEISIDPQPEIYNEKLDFFGNKTIYFSVQHPHEKLVVTAVSQVQTSTESYLQLNLSSNLSWEMVRDYVNFGLEAPIEVQQYRLASRFVPPMKEAREFAEKSFWPGRPIFEASFDIMQRIHKEFKFVPGFTTISTPLIEVFKQRKGVCQDYAHVALACLRSMGLAARYISGYIETLPPVGKEKLIGADASHAWFSVYIPETGWVDFDPTNNMIPGEKHITVAWGRDFSD